MKRAKSADEYFANQLQRGDELDKLREILLNSELEETVKWGMPTYTLQGKNIVGIGAFKDWSCLWFHEGALLKDKDAMLINAQEGKTRALRQWRFSTIDDIKEDKIKLYLNEAILNHKSGLKVKFPKRKKVEVKEVILPPLLQECFDKDNKLKISFQKLTHSQKRDYIEYIAEPKREATKVKRLEKIIPLVRSGKKLASLWQ